MALIIESNMLLNEEKFVLVLNSEEDVLIA